MSKITWMGVRSEITDGLVLLSLLATLGCATAAAATLARSWRTMVTGAHPWEGAAFLYNGRTEINAMINMNDAAAGKTNVGYTMTLNSEGTQPVNKMKSELSALERGFKMIE